MWRTAKASGNFSTGNKMFGHASVAISQALSTSDGLGVAQKRSLRWFLLQVRGIMSKIFRLPFCYNRNCFLEARRNCSPFNSLSILELIYDSIELLGTLEQAVKKFKKRVGAFICVPHIKMDGFIVSQFRVWPFTSQGQDFSCFFSFDMDLRRMGICSGYCCISKRRTTCYMESGSGRGLQQGRGCVVVRWLGHSKEHKCGGRSKVPSKSECPGRYTMN